MSDAIEWRKEADRLEDAIRRLYFERDEARAEVERLKGLVDMADELRFAVADEADSLRAERDRYRTALEGIRVSTNGWNRLTRSDSDSEVIGNVWRIAKVALTGEDET